jgi:hypothetical protein
MKRTDPAKLLRWYPRVWRERYGEEFLAMVEDSLDGRRPGWRLRLSVVWAGLRERGHRVRLAGQRAAPPVLRGLTATAVFAMIPLSLILASATEPSLSLLLLGLASLAIQSAAGTSRIRRAVRRGSRLRAAAGRGR